MADRITQLFAVAAGADGEPHGEFRSTLTSLRRVAERAASAVRKQLREISILTGLCRQFSAMDFRFLYHAERRLLAIRL